MKIRSVNVFCLIGALAMLCLPASATVQILSLTPSPASPQVLGTVVTWTATATDSGAGPLTFRFNVTPPGGRSFMARNYNTGNLSSSTWTSQPFTWLPQTCTDGVTAGRMAFTCEPVEGTYVVDVLAKDFTSGETASKSAQFVVTSLVTGTSPVVVATANPLVAIFGAPACAAGSLMRVSFQEQSLASPASTTNWIPCHPAATMDFEIAGMYPKTAYQMFAQTLTGTKIVNGPTLTFTTGALPAKTIPFPTFAQIVPAGSSADLDERVLLYNSIQLGEGTVYPNVATDLQGNIMWYYYADADGSSHKDFLTRPLENGTFLSLEGGQAWNPATTDAQLLRQVDLAGNIVRETNTGIMQQQLLALGATDAQACNAIPSPAPVGAGCLGAFHHDAIQTLPPAVGSTLPGPFTAVIADIEKIFPPGTQGVSGTLPVDIIGDMIIVLDSNWQVVWYFDAFQHDGGCPTGGGPCQLDINRPSTTGDTCVINQSGCPPMLLLGPGITTAAQDWLHANTVYYWPTDNFGGPSNDIVWSSRHQDWVMKIDYENGASTATGEILWRMGNEGDFTIDNVNNDPWPWFSHQHEVGIEGNGTGAMSMLDNGNSRIAPPPLGLGPSPACLPYDCNSRGMAVNFSETSMIVTPQVAIDLGYFSSAMGSAQLLPNGDYFFLASIVVLGLNSVVSNALEYPPSPAFDIGTQYLNLQGPESYRAWRMPSMYDPPIT